MKPVVICCTLALGTTGVLTAPGSAWSDDCPAMATLTIPVEQAVAAPTVGSGKSAKLKMTVADLLRSDAASKVPFKALLANENVASTTFNSTALQVEGGVCLAVSKVVAKVGYREWVIVPAKAIADDACVRLEVERYLVEFVRQEDAYLATLLPAFAKAYAEHVRAQRLKPAVTVQEAREQLTAMLQQPLTDLVAVLGQTRPERLDKSAAQFRERAATICDGRGAAAFGLASKKPTL